MELLKSIPDAVIVSDRQQKIVFANASAAQLFGYTVEEFQALTISDLIPDSCRGQHDEDVGKFYSHPTPREMGSGLELRGKTKSGEAVGLDIALGPFEADGVKLTLAVILPREGKREKAVTILNDLLGNIKQIRANLEG